MGYTEDSVAPEPPVLEVTIPESPSDSVTSPVVVGSAEAGARVDLYASEDCSGPILKTTAAADNGIWTTLVEVAENSVTTLTATATDAAGNQSGCSPVGLVYIHDDDDPDAPELTGTTPPSPGNSTTPTVHGTTEPGALVRLYLGDDCTGFLTGETRAGDDGTFAVQVAVAANTETTFYAQVTDASGRTSPCSDPLVYEHDGIAPKMPIVTGTDPVSPARALSPTVKGTGEAGAFVAIFTDGSCDTPAVSPAGNAVAVIAQSGAFSVQVTVPANSTTTLFAQSHDDAGNGSACSTTSTTYVHDDIAPAPPVLTATRPESPSGERNPTVVGTSEAAATVTLYGNATCTGSALGSGIAVANGGFEVVVQVPANKVTTLYGTARDRAGNVSACSATPLAYDHDDSGPAGPTITGSTPESPSRDSFEPTLAGTAEAGSTVRIHKSALCDDAPLATGPAAAGAFTIAVGLTPNSATSLYATSVDEAGNVSPCSSPAFVYVHDNLPPTPPSDLVTNPPSPSDDDEPTLRGKAEPHATVSIYVGAGCATLVGTVEVAAIGTWTFDVEVAENAETKLCVKATDEAGNTSGPAQIQYTHDAIAPEPPDLTATDPESPASDTTPTVSGASEKQATVRLYAGTCSGAPIGEGVVPGNGKLEIEARVGNNVTTQIVANATDLAGNTSDCSDPLPYTNDSQAPGAPTWDGVEPASPSNSDGTPTLSGSAEAGATVRLYANAACTGAPVATTEADGSGDFTFTPTVGANSETSFYADAVDGVGTASDCSAALVYEYDTAAPGKPTIAPTPGSPNKEPKPDFGGTTEGNATVKVYTTPDCSGTVVGTATAAANGNWSLADVSVPTNTTTTYYAAATDDADNTGACSSGAPYEHDDVKPPAPTVSSTDPGPPSNDQTPDVLGATGEAGVTIRLYTNDTCTSAVIATLTNAPASWRVAAVPIGANQTTTLYANAQDKATNVSSCSTPGLPYTHDGNAPSAPSGLVTSPVRWSRTDHSPAVSGDADAGTKVRIYRTADCTGAYIEVTADGNGDFTTDFELGTSDVEVTFAARSLDAAGNESGCSGGTLYRYDTTPPTFTGAGTATLGSGTNALSQVTLGWPIDAGNLSDNFTSAANMVFVTCISQVCGAADCDFANLADAKYSVTAAGASSKLYSGLTSNTRYYFKVRARDELTNQEANNKVVSVKTQGLNSGIELFVGEKTSCLELADGGNNSGRPACWGATSVPTSGVTDGVMFSLGSATSCALQRNGRPRCWGANTYGQVGNNTTIFQTNPVDVSNVTTAIQVDVGLEHTCALIADGTVLCWGRNNESQLGNNSITNSPVPVNVKTDQAGNPNLGDVVEIAVGDYHACARKSDGTVWCWGSNGFGRLGTGNGTLFQTATQSLMTNAKRIVAGGTHTCALRSDGRVLCWGNDSSNQLGNGATFEAASSPTLLASPTNVAGLGTSRLHTCAVTGAGAVWCWGNNISGESDNSGSGGTSVGTPMQITGMSGAVEVGGGTEYTCVRKANGEAYCWGKNDEKQLGGATATAQPQLTPQKVTATQAVAALAHISIDHEHGCATLSDGTARCWGKNSEGQLGDGNDGVAASPLVVVPGLSELVRIETGGTHSCAIGASGALSCWGRNAEGQVGDGSTTLRKSPVSVASLSGVRQVALGSEHTCALLSGGGVKCWGKNVNGQLGNGASGAGANANPGDVTGLTADAVQIASGARHTCALKGDGKVLCWGDNTTGQVKASGTGNQTTPFEVSGVKAKGIAAGGDHTCALLASGQVQCWGKGDRGQLGGNNTNNSSAPVTVIVTAPSTALGNVVRVVAGDRHSCAIALNGVGYCWGDNTPGEIGYNNAATSSTIARAVVAPLASQIEMMSAGQDDTCAFNEAGNAFCWGDNDALALGNGNSESTDARLPTQMICLP